MGKRFIIDTETDGQRRIDQTGNKCAKGRHGSEYVGVVRFGVELPSSSSSIELLLTDGCDHVAGVHGIRWCA